MPGIALEFFYPLMFTPQTRNYHMTCSHCVFRDKDTKCVFVCIYILPLPCQSLQHEPIVDIYELMYAEKGRGCLFCFLCERYKHCMYVCHLRYSYKLLSQSII